jgi:hypothetical protein
MEDPDKACSQGFKSTSGTILASILSQEIRFENFMNLKSKPGDILES